MLGNTSGETATFKSLTFLIETGTSTNATIKAAKIVISVTGFPVPFALITLASASNIVLLTHQILPH